MNARVRALAGLPSEAQGALARTRPSNLDLGAGALVLRPIAR
jgi:hypothetical protein